MDWNSQPCLGRQVHCCVSHVLLIIISSWSLLGVSLRQHQVVVKTLPPHERLMGPLLLHNPVIDGDYLVRVSNRGEPAIIKQWCTVYSGSVQCECTDPVFSHLCATMMVVLSFWTLSIAAFTKASLAKSRAEVASSNNNIFDVSLSGSF